MNALRPVLLCLAAVVAFAVAGLLGHLAGEPTAPRAPLAEVAQP